MSNDLLGKRMKEQYEQRSRYMLPRRTYTIIRVDGKAFHTFTRGFDRPFDTQLMDMMNSTAKFMCENIQGAKLAYVQSDEISILLTDFETITTDAWFDGNVQKMSSISASLATLEFNRQIETHILLGKIFDKANDKFLKKDGNRKIALFDSRVFTIPDVVEVENYLIWRQQDATRNSIQAAAQALYSPKQLHGKNTSQLQDMMHEKGINWNNYSPREKRGGLVVRKEVQFEPDAVHPEAYTRHKWEVVDCPIFTQDRSVLGNLIPKLVV
jgi:tRNA(His) guanylyltransferase